jgi:hypothetical protein
LVALEPISGIEKAGSSVVKSADLEFSISANNFTPNFSESSAMTMSSSLRE